MKSAKPTRQSYGCYHAGSDRLNRMAHQATLGTATMLKGLEILGMWKGDQSN